MKNGIIYIGNNLFETMLAVSYEEQERGLMYIDPPVPIMTFVYNKPQINRFWMANTKPALDIVFCCEGEITQICKGEPFSTSVVGDYRNSDLVIEFPYGTVVTSQIKLGHKVGLVKPDPDELRKIIAEKCPEIVKF